MMSGVDLLNLCRRPLFNADSDLMCSNVFVHSKVLLAFPAPRPRSVFKVHARVLVLQAWRSHDT